MRLKKRLGEKRPVFSSHPFFSRLFSEIKSLIDLPCLFYLVSSLVSSFLISPVLFWRQETRKKAFLRHISEWGFISEARIKDAERRGEKRTQSLRRDELR